MAVTKPELWSVRQADANYEAAQAERSAVFEKIRTPGNWKMPIYALIAAADFDDCNEAAIWFTGAGLSVVATVDDGRVRVQGPGYYETIGA